jgi:hypothetical protein
MLELFLNRLIRHSRLFRETLAAYSNETLESEALRLKAAESKAMIEELLGKLDESESEKAELSHSLEVERTKRIAAEQIAVARGAELDWLRSEFDRAQEARDAAVAERLQSLDLVNLTLLKQAEADAPPTKEQMSEWKPVPKRTQQAVPMMRQAQHKLIQGLRNRERRQVNSEADKTAPASPDATETVM